MEFEFLEDERCIGRVVRDRTAVFDRSDQWLLKRCRMPKVVLLELCQELEPVLGVQERGADLPAPHRRDEINFTVVDIIGPECVKGVIGGVDSSLQAGPSAGQQQAIHSQDPPTPTPKRRRLESRRDQ